MNGIGEVAASAAWMAGQKAKKSTMGSIRRREDGISMYDDQQEASEEFEEVTDLGPWARNSPFPGDHVAAGSFESAMQVS